MPETETAEKMDMNPKEMELETKLTQLNLAVQRSENVMTDLFKMKREIKHPPVIKR
jgi:hypothetical protein